MDGSDQRSGGGGEGSDGGGEGRQGATAAAEEKGATAEGKGKKRETAAGEKGATAEWGRKGNGVTVSGEEKAATVEEKGPDPRRERCRRRSTRREKGAAVDKEQGDAAAASEAAGEKATFFFSATAPAGKTITLVSSEGKPFKVSEEAARLSTDLADMVDNGCAGGNIPLSNVTSRALATVIKYCDKHAAAAAMADSDHGAAEGSSSSVNAAASETTLAEGDRKLVDKLTMGALLDLLLAANFLDIKGLLGAASDKVADMIKSKTPAQVRTIFGIANDFTPEEEAEIRKESPWAYEDEEPWFGRHCCANISLDVPI
ncbi:SKP1-like protein 1B [Setaria viridis]|nr:SKP1-like protein 1A [Setaria viridis]